MRSRTWLALGMAGVAASGLAYSAGFEVRHFTLRLVDVATLPPGSAPLRVLHLSDLHMTPNQGRKQNWVRRLATLEPDLVALTGDNLAHRDAVGSVLHALAPFGDTPGVMVFGSNDYYGPRPKNPARYFKVGHKQDHGEPLPWRDLRDALQRQGWFDASNARGVIDAAGRTVTVSGVDDPHLRLDDYAAVAGAPEPEQAAIALTHSPEPRVLDQFGADGWPLILAGHTHGGQLCVPGIGALVTNCELPRIMARGLHPWLPGTWLHVSAGLGTNPYTPVRFACPPEATLLRLLPRR